MTSYADDELKAILRSAELLKSSSKPVRDAEISLPKQTASSSLDISSIQIPSSIRKTTQVRDPKDLSIKENSQNNGTAEAAGNQRTKTIKTYLPPGDCRDTVDYTVIKFSTEICCRGSIGTYLRANPITIDSNSAPNPNNSLLSVNTSINHSLTTVKPQSTSGSITVYGLGVAGQGIGESNDCLVFVNIDKSKEQENVRYGMTVAIRAPAAKERLLGIKDGKPGFYRNLVGQGEKWIILKGLSSGRGPEDIDSRGKYVRVGDLVLLQAASTEQLLILHEGVNGSEAKFIHRDSAGVLGYELWQLELFRSQPNPLWLNRPYLSNQFLLQPPQTRLTSADVESRTFPGQSNVKSSQSLLSLNTYSFDDQQSILMRELLLVLSGVEGQYLRIKATSSTPTTSISAFPSPSSSTMLSIAEASKLLQQLSFTIDIDTTNRSIASQVSHLFPICESAIHIREFLRFHSRYDFGLVSHATAAAIKSIMREFDIVIAQLEYLLLTNKLSMQKLVYLLHPSKASLCGILSPLTRRLSDCSGGLLLDVLHSTLLEQGDSKARSILMHILNEAAEPFLDMLSLWLFRGEMNDPYKEFMIKEDNSISRETLQEDFNAQYWEHRYTLRENAVPKLLRDLAHRALIAGKYLNVVRECLEELLQSTTSSSQSHPQTHAQDNNLLTDSQTFSVLMKKDDSMSNMIRIRDIRLPAIRKLKLDLESSFGTSSLAEAINDAYTFSSGALLQLLRQEYFIIEHLRSLRRFFLLENGDFFIQFMDTAEEELRKEVRDVAITRIQSLLQLAVQTSTLATDLHREDLSCSLAPHNLIQHLHLIQSAGDMIPLGGSAAANTSMIASSATVNEGLKGFEALTLEYRVGWPMSIVLSKRAVTKYQLLSRLLYFSKHVERRVLLCWSDHQTTKALSVRSVLGKSYCLRHRMLHFLQNFVYYMTFEVIHPRSHEMENAIDTAHDLDELLACHERFLDLCLKECLLASQDLLKILTKIMTTCLVFADNTKSYYTGVNIEENKTDLNPIDTITRKKLSGMNDNDMKISSKSIINPNLSKQQRSEYIHRETSHESFQKMLQKFEITFDTQLKEFLDKLWTDSFRHHPQLSNLCIRLDYNGYYSGKFAITDETTLGENSVQRLSSSIAGVSIGGGY